MKQLFKDICYPHVEILEAIDHWLCTHLYPWRIRHWWQMLFNRQKLWCTHEFEASLNSDHTVVEGLMKNPEKLREYYTKLVLRRQYAHEQTLAQS